jgi:hypothetical protein
MAAATYIRRGKCGIRFVPLYERGIIGIELAIHIKDI